MTPALMRSLLVVVAVASVAAMALPAMLRSEPTSRYPATTVTGTVSDTPVPTTTVFGPPAEPETPVPVSQLDWNLPPVPSPVVVEPDFPG